MVSIKNFGKITLPIRQKMLLFFLIPITIILGIACLYILSNLESNTQNHLVIFTIGVYLFIILLVLLLILYVSKSISSPLIHIQKKLDLIAQGKSDQDYTEVINTFSEIRSVEMSYNKLLTAWKNVTQFTESIKNGNVDSEYKLLSEQDQLGKSLIDMRNQIKESSKQKKQQQEQERKRYWTS